MDEYELDSNKKTRILLARNTPVALVVEAGGFFGSHLVDKLLDKGIQVVGTDELTAVKKGNLAKATENKNFHLISGEAGGLYLELQRLDYIFICGDDRLNLKRILELFKKHRSRLLLLSSINLYDVDELADDLKGLAQTEEDIAGLAQKMNLNARILRLGPVFGPRMDLKDPDPLIKLVAQAINGDLQKEVSLEFSTRALYISDAVDLAIKCILAGATAQKIFDGVMPAPIKVAEVKQILLDPIWYENKKFEPSELPPWPTPNLEKTIRFLSWHPYPKLVENLRKTMQFFKDNEIKVPELDDRRLKIENREKDGGGWKTEKMEDLKVLKGEEVKEIKKEIINTKGIRIPKFSLPVSALMLIMALTLITYALIWPIIEMGWGVLTFRYQLSEAVKNLQKGEFEASLFNVSQAQGGVKEAKFIFDSLGAVRKTGFLKSQFELGDNLSTLATLSADSAENTILGIQALYQSLKAVTGESAASPKEYFDLAATHLASADEDLSKAIALIKAEDFKSNLPELIKGRVESLSARLSVYYDLIKKGRSIATLLPEVVALDGKKDYLILLQNNNELRPTGGFIGSFAKISLEGGKLRKLEVSDVYALDGQLPIHVDPPKEIKEDLGQKDFFLRDSNWEPDFPTSARQAEWFYTKESGERVEGVVAMDISAMEDLLRVVGPLDLADYNEKISADNLFERAITHAEVSFFPGTQAKKSFLTALAQGLFNKLFFLPNQNWPGIVSSLGKSLDQKHLSVYLDNPRLFSYLISQNWGGVLPRVSSDPAEPVSDFLAPVEANLGANKANYYLDRNYNLETVVGKDGDISHRLRISYTNRSPSDVFPAGLYKNRMRIYLPFGTKLTRVLWAEKDITKNVSSFVDYGRSGYSFLLELSPKEQKTLVLDYAVPVKLNFKDNTATYRLDVVKQAGTLKDPFVWNLTYPLNLKLVANQSRAIGPQEQTIQTDLSKDRSFEVTFQK